ncbi:2Fe-2S iron-sulfur cluster binding domain-containing protein [Sphingomonas sp. TF3]|uniref:2Fe-2S iron-sulfur cluster-binding protein n=1 Tax=Sphingomonas sp. TF3 TaxID=2495580 RepID=UPI000F87F297|nr:2Fe-2S iron-sulfur cluster-binding protein [Sphingomonas sp. TF3]RUN78356.1 2Fe-2S iron-sulfur cluster binding domain-containing protein [Sphingomonas sp. TF3]
MAKLTVVTRDGSEHKVVADAASGYSLMEIIRDNGFDELEATCGGCCSCATCHVLVDPVWMPRLPAISDAEIDLLDGAAEREETSRLSCQVAFTPELDGIRVTIAPE